MEIGGNCGNVLESGFHGVELSKTVWDRIFIDTGKVCYL
jgi:hypothetical protein